MLNGVKDNLFSPKAVNNNGETHYGIWYPSSCFTLDFDESESLPLVVKTYDEVKVILKKYKSCRFKATKSREEALMFAKMPPDQILSPCAVKKINGEEEKGSVFRTPKPQEIVKLRSAIEREDEDVFKQTVWSNPRYLIGQADNPTIFHEGCRYNALHIAAKAKPKMCRLLIETIENPAFMQMMYSDEKPADCLRRTKYLVDLYLNMREKGCNETPLHIAAKFGHVEVVSILSSHPACDKTLVNKFGDTAKATAFSRCHPRIVSQELKDEMAKAFEEKYYVAILMNSDESSPPYVSTPLSPTKRNLTLEELVTEKQSSSIFTSPVMRAVAGPMSENEAKDFHKMLKTPSQMLPPDSNRSIKLSDLEKGYERIGRYQAKKMNIDWKEKWPFGLCDVTQQCGLEMLENFLKSKWEELLLKEEHPTNSTSDCSSISDDLHSNSFCNNSLDRDMSELCINFENLGLNSPENYKNCDQISQLESDYADRLCKDIARKLREILEKEHFLNGEDLRYLLPNFNCLQSSQDINVLKTIHSKIAELIGEDINFDINFQSNRMPFFNKRMISRSFDEGSCNSVYRINNCLNREELLTNFIRLEEHVNCIFNQLQLLCEKSQMETFNQNEKSSLCCCTWIDEIEDSRSVDEFFTPPMSPTDSSDSSASDDEYLSPMDERELFMNGTIPSKLDADVVRALGDTEINPLVYPNIHKWKCLVDSYSIEEVEKWRAPTTSKKIGSPLPVEVEKSRGPMTSKKNWSPLPILKF